MIKMETSNVTNNFRGVKIIYVSPAAIQLSSPGHIRALFARYRLF